MLCCTWLDSIRWVIIFSVISLCVMMIERHCGVQVVLDVKKWLHFGLCYLVKMVYRFVMCLIG